MTHMYGQSWHVSTAPHRVWSSASMGCEPGPSTGAQTRTRACVNARPRTKRHPASGGRYASMGRRAAGLVATRTPHTSTPRIAQCLAVLGSLSASTPRRVAQLPMVPHRSITHDLSGRRLEMLTPPTSSLVLRCLAVETVLCSTIEVSKVVSAAQALPHGSLAFFKFASIPKTNGPKTCHQRRSFVAKGQPSSPSAHIRRTKWRRAPRCETLAWHQIASTQRRIAVQQHISITKKVDFLLSPVEKCERICSKNQWLPLLFIPLLTAARTNQVQSLSGKHEL